MENKFIEVLTDLIKTSGKSQTEISIDLGIRKQKITNWKTGYVEPNIDDLIMLAKYFQVTTDYLLGLEQENVSLIQQKTVGDLQINIDPELLKIYPRLTPAQQENLLNYARGMNMANELSESKRSGKRSDIA